MKIQVSHFKTRLGGVVVYAREGAVCALGFASQGGTLKRWLKRRFGACTFQTVQDAGGARAALRRYLAGDFKALCRLSTDAGGTPFQQRVWRALVAIPAGRTLSYAALARRVGRPSAVRAVASANARNPISIVIPCHRVIGSDGSLRGYGGGMGRKRMLLEHEHAHGAAIA